MTCQIPGSPEPGHLVGFRDSNLGVPRKSAIWMWVRRSVAEYTIWGMVSEAESILIFCHCYNTCKSISSSVQYVTLLKYFSRPSFRYLPSSNTIHTTKAGTTNRWEATSSNPP
jgi:hypothetical protein